MVYIYNRQDQKRLRPHLRKNQTITECLVWSKVRNHRLLGFKFRRQYGIESYIVDFCCPEAKLAVEVDGDSHYISEQAKQSDLKRQKDIEGLGFIVLRFTNKDISENLDGALEVIAKNLKQ